MNRRAFVRSLAPLLLTVGAGRLPAFGRALAASDLDEFIRARMATHHIPGAVACIVRGGVVEWTGEYGWADLERRVPMTMETVQNIASISKTFTTTALMQLWEQGSVGLDDDVNDHLPFSIRNPHRPDRPITIRHLLTHRSSMRDGRAYSQGYACHDPSSSLEEWVAAYLVPGGALYDPDENYHHWAPDERWDYTNISYGVLAYLVERIGGAAFDEQCQERIFRPLGMDSTNWYLAEVDPDRHAVPYTWVGGDRPRGPDWGGEDISIIWPPGEDPRMVGEGYVANCLYNHPNFPDGFLRTSMADLLAYVNAYLLGGQVDGRRIMQPGTVQTMLTENLIVEATGRVQGLTWSAPFRIRGEPAWGHGGSDPGVNTDVRLVLGERLGAAVFFNTNGVSPHEVTRRMLEVSPPP